MELQTHQPPRYCISSVDCWFEFLSWPSLLPPLVRFMDDHQLLIPSIAHSAAEIPLDTFCTNTFDSFIKTKERVCCIDGCFLDDWYFVALSKSHCVSFSAWLPFCHLEVTFSLWLISGLNFLSLLEEIWPSCLIKWLLKPCCSCLFSSLLPKSLLLFSWAVWSEHSGWVKMDCEHSQSEKGAFLMYSPRPNSPCPSCINSSTSACTGNNQCWSNSMHPSLSVVAPAPTGCQLQLQLRSQRSAQQQSKGEAQWLSGPPVHTVAYGTPHSVSERHCCCITSSSL